MKIFYDGANLDEINEVTQLGIISGITTNLSSSKKIMIKEKIDYDNFKDKIFDAIKAYNQRLSLSFQVSKNEPKDIYEEAINIHEKYKGLDLKVKVPINYENLEVINKLVKKGVKVNATCVTSFTQGVVAANVGCSYVSFFWGRMTDADIDAQKIVNNFRNLLDKNGLSKNVEILVGSLRHQGVISDAYIAGADIVTMGFENIKKLSNHFKSDEANLGFQKEWNK
jgi:transaldolase